MATDEADGPLPQGVHGRERLASDHPDDQGTIFSRDAPRRDDGVKAVPQRLGPEEINSVLPAVAFAFAGVELEPRHNKGV